MVKVSTRGMPTPWISQVIYSIPITHLLLYTVYLITMSDGSGSRMYAPKKNRWSDAKDQPFVCRRTPHFGARAMALCSHYDHEIWRKHDPQTFPENFPVNDHPLTSHWPSPTNDHDVESSSIARNKMQSSKAKFRSCMSKWHSIFMFI